MQTITNSNSHLSEDEIYFITEFKQPAKQCAHLAKIGIPFFPTRFGKPRVVRSAVENAGIAITPKKRQAPNEDALRAKIGKK